MSVYVGEVEVREHDPEKKDGALVVLHSPQTRAVELWLALASSASSGPPRDAHFGVTTSTAFGLAMSTQGARALAAFLVTAAQAVEQLDHDARAKACRRSWLLAIGDMGDVGLTMPEMSFEVRTALDQLERAGLVMPWSDRNVDTNVHRHAWSLTEKGKQSYRVLRERQRRDPAGGAGLLAPEVDDGD